MTNTSCLKYFFSIICILNRIKKISLYITYSFHKYKNWISVQFNSKISRSYRYSTLSRHHIVKDKRYFPHFSSIYHSLKISIFTACIDATFLPNYKLFENYHKFTSHILRFTKIFTKGQRTVTRTFNDISIPRSLSFNKRRRRTTGTMQLLCYGPRLRSRSNHSVVVSYQSLRDEEPLYSWRKDISSVVVPSRQFPTWLRFM